MKRTLGMAALLGVLLAGCAAPAQPTSTTPIDTGVNPESWAMVPAGEFQYGIHEEEVNLDHAYGIMITPVTNQQFAVYLNQALTSGALKLTEGKVIGYYAGDEFHAKKHEERIAAGDWLHFPVNAEGSRIAFRDGKFGSFAGYENHPVTMVTWFGAQDYCAAQKGSLPTSQEWEKAARGDRDNRAYPWGNALARNQANYYGSRDVFEQALGQQGETTPVGYYNGRTYGDYATLDSASPFGLYDMAGNVWQWTSDITAGIHYRYLRGGSHMDYGYNLRVWTRNNVRPDYTGSSIGFRCVRAATR